jgi:glycosyltransferase involved in cell wall biosynthesis
VLVPAGDPGALATALRELAADPALLARTRAAASELARTAFTPAAVTATLHDRLLAVVPRRTTS